MAGLCEGGNEPPGSLKAIKHVHGSNALELLHLRCAVTMPYLKLYTSRKQLGRPSASPSSHLRVVLVSGWMELDTSLSEERNREDVQELAVEENRSDSA
ncbi:hypothetical protein ANN_01500 [Periplaneta americana]|uniref:Uncharacterized protein n=1 Tax=Periplaneta americana TaxID=6978 RepID=A0ABQ8TW65_PERAM|nr:hypothetical protein ANN_01500 [Periplaneta americana]